MVVVAVEKASALDGARLQDYYCCCPDDDRHLEHHQRQLDLETDAADAADANDTWTAAVPSVPG